MTDDYPGFPLAPRVNDDEARRLMLIGLAKAAGLIPAVAAALDAFLIWLQP